MPLEFTDYDPAWPGLADQAKAELTAALPGLFSTIEHFGSTSVPGLAAKPIIDLMAATHDLDLVRARDRELARLGYRFYDAGMPARWCYRRGTEAAPTHHLHVVLAGTFTTRNELVLRDYLRRTPEAAHRYADLKRQLARQHDTPEGYTRAKTELIQELTDSARAELGLPSVPVWEE